MKQFFSLGALCLLLALAIPAYGDIAKPKEKPTPSPELPKFVLHTRLVVVPDNKLWEAKLQISQSSLQELRAALGNGNESTAQSITRSSTRTIIAGVFMFLSLSFAGVWLARSGQRRNHKAIAAVILIATMFGLATVIVRANAGPPGYVRWQNLPANLTKGQATEAGVDIEIMPGDDSTIKLIVPMRNTNRPSE